MDGKSKVGKEGEDTACDFLKSKKYKILERNWKRTFGELDIVAMERGGTLIFVEVKTMGFFSGGIEPEDHMTRGKMERFRRAAEAYAGSHPKLVDDKRGFRCDVLALTKIGSEYLIKHYENV